ncbi:MAG: hypothetical protein U5K75_04110 [Ahrensia sp.]|nr:hypothetical protein [Ahrensia sp.]
MNWLEKNSKALQALAAIATIIFGLGALIGAKLQIDASARLHAVTFLEFSKIGG